MSDFVFISGVGLIECLSMQILAVYHPKQVKLSQDTPLVPKYWYGKEIISPRNAEGGDGLALPCI